MKSSFRLLLVVSAILSLTNCDKPAPPAAATTETDSQLAEARDALQRQALEIETKTALMDKQLADMAQSLKDRDNAELRNSLEALKRQNEELRGQAEAARRQSNAIADRIVTPQPLNVAPQSMALPDYSLFYERLAPFGRWFEVNGYGYCWRPTITVAGWRPYVDGCWVWSSLGWAWQSNEPFGWATYHYGRWVNLARYGWIWVPGSDWAPAWVAWRQSRDCVGWAPLPPEPGVCSGVYRDCDSRYGLGPASYTFISTTQFVSPTYINIYAPVTRQTTIFQQSVNVTQIVPSHSRDHAFVHQGGPPRGQMEQACRQPVPQRQVQPVHADQMPVRQPPHGRRDATAPVALVELPAVSPGVHMKRPEIKERIQKPVLMGGFEGVPQQAAREIRENIDREKETAAVQQPPAHGRMPHQPGRHPSAPPVADNPAPMAQGAPSKETAISVVSAGDRVPVQGAPPVESNATQQQQPARGDMPPSFPRRSAEAPVSAGMPAVPNTPAQETVRPAIAAEPGAARESRHHGQPGMRNPQAPNVPPEGKAAESSASAATPSVPSVMPAVVENKAPESPVTPVVPVSAPESTPPAVVGAPPAAMPQPTEPAGAQPPVAAEKMAIEAEKGRMHRDREQGQAAAMEQRQQQEMQERGLAEKKAAEQAAMTAEAEKSRMQSAAAQQEALVAQQQRMAADQAAAETEKARQQAAATAAQQQQEMAAQQQRATAERMASEQAAAAAAAEAERARQQNEAAAMQQRQQEEAARRAAEEQQMKAQQEAERRTQEMAAQRQAEEQARRQQEAEMQRAQEQARRTAEEQQMRAQQEAERRAQEMAQRQAEEQARRQQEAEMQRAQEQARRAAEEQQMRAQQEAAQRAQEMAQRQAEEQARRAQEMAQRQAEEQARRAQEMAQRQAEEQARRAQEEAQRAAAEAAQRAAAEAARNQPQPAPGS